MRPIELRARPRNSATDDSSPGRKEERKQALSELVKLYIDRLQKTALQVRVVVEVIHCQTARHIILEAIDFLDPTLAIIGSRERSTAWADVKTSFSRWLIPNSSVPVMTARMKPCTEDDTSTTQAQPAMTNNIATPTEATELTRHESEADATEADRLKVMSVEESRAFKRQIEAAKEEEAGAEC